jgi:hypothetical protein
MIRSSVLFKHVPSAMAVAGAAGAALAFVASARERFWASFVVWFLFVLTVGLGALFLVALNHLVGARWSVPLRRATERIASLVVPAAPLAVVGLLALPVLYPWTFPEAAKHPAIAAKSAWLNVPFFAGRTIGCAALLVLFFALVVGGSIRQDRTKDPALSVRAKHLSAGFMFVFAITITVVAFDWVSSLLPEWYSDIFGVYLFAGTFLAGLAAASLAAVFLVSRGRLPGVRPDHLYNLGGLMFAFTVFWSYIAFAQYMLIWYANLPEEVVWYKQRIEGPWLGVVLALAALHFVAPFFLLLGKDQKSDVRTLGAASVSLLAAHVIDLYWMVFPALGRGPIFGWAEASFALMFVGGGLCWLRRSMAWGADFPVGDPLLQEGLENRP